VAKVPESERGDFEQALVAFLEGPAQ
jgi:hypothetical protein